MAFRKKLYASIEALQLDLDETSSGPLVLWQDADTDLPERQAFGEREVDPGGVSRKQLPLIGQSAPD